MVTAQSFMVTAYEPAMLPDEGRVMVGEALDVVVIAETFPLSRTIGVYLELAFDEDDAGVYLLRVLAEPDDGSPRKPIGERAVTMPPVTPDWWALRLLPWGLAVTLDYEGELDLQLLVELTELDDYGDPATEPELIAERPLFVRGHPAAGL